MRTEEPAICQTCEEILIVKHLFVFCRNDIETKKRNV